MMVVLDTHGSHADAFGDSAVSLSSSVLVAFDVPVLFQCLLMPQLRSATPSYTAGHALFIFVNHGVNQ